MIKNKPKSRYKRKGGRGALILIMGFFLASGLLRLGSGTGSAIAREVEALNNQFKTEESVLKSCENGEGVDELLTALRAREMRVAEREFKLENRIQALSVAEVGIERKLTALITAEEKLRATMALADTASEDDLSRLTSVYESMKPRDAAALFEEMDPQFSAGFIGRMRTDAAAKIIAGLTPEKAHSISVILAGRNAEVPTK